MPSIQEYGDGVNKVFKMPVFTGTPTATVNGGAAPLTAAPSKDFVTITTTPPAGSVVVITYTTDPIIAEDTKRVAGFSPRNDTQPGNPLYVATAKTALPAAATDGRNVDLMADPLGRQVTQPIGLPQTQDAAKVTCVLTTTETTLIAATASVRRGLVDLCVANRDNVPHTIDFRGTTGGAVLHTVIIPAGQSWQFDWAAALWQAAVNTNWTYQLRETSTTAVEISYVAHRVNY